MLRSLVRAFWYTGLVRSPVVIGPLFPIVMAACGSTLQNAASSLPAVQKRFASVVLPSATKLGASSAAPPALYIPIASATSTAASWSGGSSLGLEDSGNLSIVNGVRTTNENAQFRASPFRLPPGVISIVRGPAHLGGGYFYRTLGAVYRSETWLSEPAQIAALTSPQTTLFFGTDSVVLQGATTRAIDARTGQERSLASFPSGPAVSALIAFDEQRALALSDGLGLQTTRDGGKHWTTVAMPFSIQQLTQSGGKVFASAVAGSAGANRDQGATATVELTPEGEIVQMNAPRPKTANAESEKNLALYSAAIKYGYPLADGTMLMLRNGALIRFDPETGRAVPIETNVPTNSECHPFPLKHNKVQTVGFACSDSRAGATTLWAYDGAAISVLSRFAGMRTVLSSSSGMFAVKGACASEKIGQSYCVYGPDEKLRELEIQGDTESVRIVALQNGQTLLVSPPKGTLQNTRITLLSNGKASTVAVSFSALRADVMRILEKGTWLDGFEERAPGKVGGWVEHNGLYVGLEIDSAGEAKVGQVLADAGVSAVSGRYGLHWSSVRRGFQTTDGGLNWTAIEQPDSVNAPSSNGANGLRGEHVCSASGCMGEGWIRVGWGEPKAATQPATATPPAPPSLTSSGRLRCEPLALPAIARTIPGKPKGDDEDDRPRDHKRSEFHGRAMPKLRPEWNVATSELYAPQERYSRSAPLGRLVAWTPKDGDWATQASFVVQWLSPFEDSSHVRTSAVSKLPSSLKDLVVQRNAMSAIIGDTRISVSEDSDHALLTSRSWTRRNRVVFTVSKQQTFEEVRREDGEDFDEIEASVFHEGRWFVAVTESDETKLFVIETGVAKLVSRAPRNGVTRLPVRLAKLHESGNVLFALEAPARGSEGTEQWLLQSSLTNTPPVALAPKAQAFGVLGSLNVCKSTMKAYAYDGMTESSLPYNLEIVDAQDKLQGTAHTLSAHVQLSKTNAPCIARLSGTLDSGLASWAEAARSQGSSPPLKDSVILVGAADGMRRSLRCVLSK
jgi:hypothetical protein